MSRYSCGSIAGLAGLLQGDCPPLETMFWRRLAAKLWLASLEQSIWRKRRKHYPQLVEQKALSYPKSIIYLHSYGTIDL